VCGAFYIEQPQVTGNKRTGRCEMSDVARNSF
jgi:hypothetical protein